jgi:hypothetical protein
MSPADSGANIQTSTIATPTIEEEEKEMHDEDEEYI